MRTETVRSGEVTLHAAVFGDDEPAVLFANAVGMENALLAGLGEQFRAHGLNLITWELRGSPGAEGPARVTLDDHTADALAVLEALGITRAHVVGWCTGASIALFATCALAERALSFTSVDGALLFTGTPGARLGNAVFDMCAKISADSDRAGFYHDVVRPRGNESAVLGVPDEELTRMLTRPYRQDVEALTRFAFGIHATCDYDPAAACAQLAVPSQFIAREDDEMVSHRHARRAAELVAGAKLSVIPTGGHYALFTDSAGAAGAMAAFMHGAVRREAGPLAR
ncbi:alpha/beta fold hydrolase [Streptantibioticus ferralitis]|uniref:Alpha/beta hydrolase n=1 Tax=Streptantibioticus ferralitis TaxID=236510 RepID=A0ABT5YVP6_9ACTN|nr:alpha/beta hydrolase [Streptantibioticus ferralitis]MDF2255504.1 alpha/beta hydrolase [Streptantibioticus ferralitis]